MKPKVLVIIPPQVNYPSTGGYDMVEELSADFEVYYAPNAIEADKLIAKVGSDIRAVVCNNSIGLRGDQIRAMPQLELIQARGAGFERIDIEAMREKGIIFANARHVNFFSTAEHAMAILLMLVRDLRTDDLDVHNGLFKECKLRPPRQVIYGKRMGILGLGDIGLEIATRAIGFGVSIKYHNKHKRNDVPYEYVGSVVELAAESDILMISVPGGPGTQGIVNREVLDAVGPYGYVVNVGRGSVVDTRALVDALHEKRIAGAALDVVDGEPDIPEYVFKAPNLIITPHVAASSLLARKEGVQHCVNNLKAHFSGRPIISRVL